MLEPLLIILAVLVFVAFWGLWLLWMRFCLRLWINKWADSLSLRIRTQKVYFVHRGPFRFALPFLPVYRVECQKLIGRLSIRMGEVGSKVLLRGQRRRNLGQPGLT